MSKAIFNKDNQAEVVSFFSVMKPEAIQEALSERSKLAALAFGVELLEQEVEQLCGAAFARKAEGMCRRGGSEKTSIVVGSQRMPVTRPRVRNEDGEVKLSTLEMLRSQDLLDDRIREKMLLGVSSRKYGKVIDAYAESLGVSKSAASRAFKRASQKELDSINEADLSELCFVGLIIDGINVSGRTVVAALGITADLKKVPVGLKDGDTENTQVVKDLLADLQNRNFTLYCTRLLAIIDGGKALRKALRAVWGDKVLVQRCWLHKLRNIEGYIPKKHHAALLFRMRKLMGLKNLKDAQRDLLSLRTWLVGISHDAAASLDEAGTELLTLHALGIGGELRKSLYSTNPIESLFSVVRGKIRRVKNWNSQKSQQPLRWIASAILDHKKSGMRGLRGQIQKSQLIAALNAEVDEIKKAA